MKFGSKRAIFGVIWGGFEGFGPCLGISHPTHPHLGEISPPKKVFFDAFPKRKFSANSRRCSIRKMRGAALPVGLRGGEAAPKDWGKGRIGTNKVASEKSDGLVRLRQPENFR